jgi:hypothetical protein
MLPYPFQETRIAVKIKIVAPGDFVEIARNNAIVGDRLSALEKSFRDADVWSMERLLTRPFWRVGN